MLELDVHLTADEVVVVSHDDHLVRTTGEDIYITKTCYKVSVGFDHCWVRCCSPRTYSTRLLLTGILRT